ncbi:cytochrome P450 [Mycena floridula]|nr:cytochrome P450 [Mycena floridula]
MDILAYDVYCQTTEFIFSPSVLTIALLVLVISRLLKLRAGIKAVNSMPGFRTPFYPLSFPGVLTSTRWFWKGYDLAWARRSELYKEGESFSVVPFLCGPVGLYTSNLEIAKQVIVGGHKTSFIKPESMSRPLLMFGMNLFAADSETWKRHRKVLSPAFNTDLYRAVWTKTIHTYREMVNDEGWIYKDAVEIPVVQTLTYKVALLVLGTCGLGFSVNWTEPLAPKNGSMTVQQSLRIVASTFMYEIFFPKWLSVLPIPKLRESRLAFDTLLAFMKEHVQYRKNEISAGSQPRDNAFSMLVHASEAETEKLKLSDEELIGNLFTLLIVGQESTAHALAATLGFLSIHDEVQESIYEEIMAVVGPDRDPLFEEYGQLTKVRASFYEALRMFPGGHLMVREATEDTVIQVPLPLDEEGTTRPMAISKGMQIVVDMVGVQNNPRYFDRPEQFNPSRWYDLPSESEAYTAFSLGGRACIGRRFTTSESVCFLAMLLRDWRIKPILNPGETKEAWRNRVMDASLLLALGVKSIPLRLERRKQM